MTGMDLASFDGLKEAQENGVEIELKHPKTTKGLGFHVTVAGPDSTKQRRAYRQVADARLKAGAEQLSFDEQDEENIFLIASTVMSWRFDQGVTLDGKTPACTQGEVEKVLRRFPFMREQVAIASGNRGSFMKG